ncbi:hypothetical protein HOD38_00060 [archaeon]|jgi:hypothetical protein|nr:hypothetical protein [archaeon]MBT4396640.1 hypothetical protein [archaeon]MBT4441250.1 hypothetical protein [archaeon]MBT4722302.1 hypothetical protein [Candidatus Falkowbacteria bacterium]
MKKILFIVMILLMVGSVSAVQTVITKTEEFRLDLVKYDPSPVQPGETSDLHFEITNLQDEIVNDLEFTIVETFPFFLDEFLENTIEIDSLASGEMVEFVVPISVNANVDDGFYSFSLDYYSEVQNARVSEDFTIYVQRVNRIVSATSIAVESSGVENIPGILEPGEIGKMNVVVENSAGYTMEDVSIKLLLNASSVPFAPIGSTAEKHVASIGSGDYENVVFDIIALPDADAGVYKVSFEIQYYDELGNLYVRNDLIGMVIGSVPEFHLEIKESEIKGRGGTGDVTLNIVNTGLSQVKFMTIQLEESEDYEILSEDILYLGDIDSDDDESATFLLDLRTLSDNVELPITLSFRDSNNQRYEQSFTPEFTIYNLGNGALSVGWIVSIVIVLAVIGIIFRKRLKKLFKKKR